MNADCIFCRIAAGEIPSGKVYEDELVFAFRDLNPQAPVHVLVVPKAHVTGLGEADKLPEETLAALLLAAQKVARITGIDKTGFRVVANYGADACQSVHHLHLHVLGGQKMSETMT